MATSPSTISRLRCSTRAISTDPGPVSIPNSAARRTRAATFALQISFLLGRQLMFGHEPPTQRRSTTTVRCPAWAMCHDTAEDEDGYATQKLSALCAHDHQLLGD